MLPAMSVAVSAEISAVASAAIPPGFAVHYIDSPLYLGVSYVIKLLHLEYHPPHMNFNTVRALFEGGVNFA